MTGVKDFFLIGHESKRAALKRLYNKDRIPPAFILAGPAGTGKKLVALELYRTYYCEQGTTKTYGGCGTCKNCRLLLEGTLPNFTFADCADKDQASVEFIRSLLRGLHLMAGGQQKKVTILDNADHLSVQAQNILLKALEEPRPNTFFALITSVPSKLLFTIQSRCQLWHFDVLTDQQILQLIERRSLKSELQDIDAQTLALLADGSMQNIHTLLEYQLEWQQARELLKAISKQQFSEVFASLQEIKTNKDLLKMRLSICRILARQAMLKSNATRKSYAWSVFLTNIILAEQMIFERNLSAELVLQNMSISLASSSRFQSYTVFSHDARLLSSVTV